MARRRLLVVVVVRGPEPGAQMSHRTGGFCISKAPVSEKTPSRLLVNRGVTISARERQPVYQEAAPPCLLGTAPANAQQRR